MLLTYFLLNLLPLSATALPQPDPSPTDLVVDKYLESCTVCTGCAGIPIEPVCSGPAGNEWGAGCPVGTKCVFEEHPEVACPHECPCMGRWTARCAQLNSGEVGRTSSIKNRGNTPH
jgi:hypothetical protein